MHFDKWIGIDFTYFTYISNEQFQFYWCMPTKDIQDESASQELLKLIADLWIVIHGFSYACAYVEQHKHCTKVPMLK